MSILNLSFLLNGGHKLLLEEGYILKDTIITDDEQYDKKFIDPYYLYDKHGDELDVIYYIEYCNKVIDDEYLDGRLKWETICMRWEKYVNQKLQYIYI